MVVQSSHTLLEVSNVGRKRVRRSQAVVPFGVGAIVDFEAEALMAAGLDAWPDEKEVDCLYDERLAARMHVSHFRQPPAAEDGKSDPLPYVRFPYWHFCPRCRGLQRLTGNEQRAPRCELRGASPARKTGPPCNELQARQRRQVLPLRFVVACAQGHIEDFPWEEWAHTEKGQAVQRHVLCATPQLYFYATQRGGLAGLVVHCTGCGKKRSLLGATGELKGYKCSGARPWLGPGAVENCASTDPPQVLQRGASNIYFPSVESSVLIPPFSKKVRITIDNPNVWRAITAQRDQGQIPDSSIRVVAGLNSLPFEELRAAVLAKDAGDGVSAADQTEAQYRFDEYKALQRTNDVRGDLLVTRPQPIDAYDGFAREILESVVLVESLAETRALSGFSRIEDGPPNSAMFLKEKDWRPAYRVHGEGIFLVFRKALFDAWTIGGALDVVLGRAENEPRIKMPPTPQFVALHTLAHLLILRLAFEAGYGASSIRERLYTAPEDSTTPMRGILLYTAAGDAEGTLGGLVRLGKPGNLEKLIRNAIADARWCSADPVCRESAGQGLNSLNLAACHACALLPETSCETGNRLLDRLSVIGGGRDASERPGIFTHLI